MAAHVEIRKPGNGQEPLFTTDYPGIVQGVEGGTPVTATLVNSLGQANSDANPLYVLASSSDGTSSLLGAVNETAPATDTASSGLNGRLQRLAQDVSAFCGTVAAGVAAAKSALVGAVYRSTQLTFTDGQQGALTMGSRGALLVQLKIPDSVTDVGSTVNGADGISNALAGLRTLTFPSTYNAASTGGTWDRVRGNLDQTVGITAAGVTITQTGADQTNYNGRGVTVVLDMTSIGTGNVTLSIQGKDNASGKYYTIFTGAAVSTNSTNVYTVYPGITAAANVSAAAVLPRVWRVVVTANNANATTYTVGACVQV